MKMWLGEVKMMMYGARQIREIYEYMQVGTTRFRRLSDPRSGESGVQNLDHGAA
jgi:hypothetical protein